MHMFGAWCILVFAVFCFFEEAHFEVSLTEDTDILKAESAIRKTANDLFYTLGLRKIQEIPRLHQHALVHNYFITLTLQGYINQKEIIKLTRVDKGNSSTDRNNENGTTDFIAILNDIHNEDNVLKLQSLLLGDDARTGYDVKSELEKLEYLKKFHENYYNRSTDLRKTDTKMSEAEESLEVYNVPTNKAYNDSGEFWDDDDDDDEEIPERRIFSGKRTKRKYYPFIASVQIFGKFQCAGSIIKSDLVITAASCLQLAWNNRFYRENPHFLSVRVGSSFYEVGGESIDVIEVYFYPSYNPKNLRHNLAIMRLYRHIKMKRKRVQKIQIGGAVSKNAGRILVVGWGAYTVGNVLHSQWEDKLRYAELDQYPLDDCQDIYSKDYVTQSNFCAGFVSIGSGACNRDAGGPGVLSGKLAGVISFGAPVCGTPDNPTVFTKLIYYLDWIEDIMEQRVPVIKQRTTFKPRTYAYSHVRHILFDRNKNTPILTKDPLVYNVKGKSIEPVPVTQKSIQRLDILKHHKHDIRENTQEVNSEVFQEQNPRHLTQIPEEPMLDEPVPMDLLKLPTNKIATTPVFMTESVSNEIVKEHQPTVMDYKEIEAKHDVFPNQAKIETTEATKQVNVIVHKKSKRKHKESEANLLQKLIPPDPYKSARDLKREYPKLFAEAEKASSVAKRDHRNKKSLHTEKNIKPVEDFTRARLIKARVDHDKPLQFWDLSTESQEGDSESEVFNDGLQNFAHRAQTNNTLINSPIPFDENNTPSIPDKSKQDFPLLLNKTYNSAETKTHKITTVKQKETETSTNSQVVNLNIDELLAKMTENLKSNQGTLTQDQREAILNYQPPLQSPQTEKSLYRELLAFQAHLDKGINLDKDKIVKQIHKLENMDNSNKNIINQDVAIQATEENSPLQNEKLKSNNLIQDYELDESPNQQALQLPIQDKDAKSINQDYVIQDEEFANLDDTEGESGETNQDKRKVFNSELAKFMDQGIPIEAVNKEQDEAPLNGDKFNNQEVIQPVDQQEFSRQEHENNKHSDLDSTTEIQEEVKPLFGENTNQGHFKEWVLSNDEKAVPQTKQVNAVNSQFSIPTQEITKSGQQKRLDQVQEEIKLDDQNDENIDTKKEPIPQENPYEFKTKNDGSSDIQELLAHKTADPIETTFEKENLPHRELMAPPVESKLSTNIQDLANAYQYLLKEAEEAANPISTTNELPKHGLYIQDEKLPETSDQRETTIAMGDIEKVHVTNSTKSIVMTRKSADQEDAKPGELLNQVEMNVKSFLKEKMDNAVHSLLASSNDQNATNTKIDRNMSNVSLENKNAILRTEIETTANETAQSKKPQIHIFRNSLFTRKDISKLIALFKATSKIEHSFRSGMENNETFLYDKYREFLRLYKNTLEGSDFENASKETINEGKVRRSMNVVENETEIINSDDDEDNTTDTISASEAADIKRNVLDYINI